MDFALTTAARMRAEGNVHFRKGTFSSAIAQYEGGLSVLALVGPDADAATQLEVATLQSNLSAVYVKLGDSRKAQQHAEACVAAHPSWAKGHRRLAAARALTGQPVAVFTALCTSLALEIAAAGVDDAKLKFGDQVFAVLHDVDNLLELCWTARGAAPGAASGASTTVSLLACDSCQGVLCRPVTHAACGGSADWVCVAADARCLRCLAPWPVIECAQNVTLAALLDTAHATNTTMCTAYSLLAEANDMTRSSPDERALLARRMAEAVADLEREPRKAPILHAAVLAHIGKAEDAVTLLDSVADAQRTAAWPRVRAHALLLAQRPADAWAALLSTVQQRTSGAISGTVLALVRPILRAVLTLPSSSFAQPAPLSSAQLLADIAARVAGLAQTFAAALDTPPQHAPALDFIAAASCAATPPACPTATLAIDMSAVTPDDVECRLCFNLLLVPVAAPCGHVFCKTCLIRALDHTPSCPFCRADLRIFTAERVFCPTRAIEALIEHQFPTEIALRRTIETEEMAAQAQNAVPLFVCALAMPGLPCPLHVFEPRYRLMIRRAVEANGGHFGMILPSPQRAHASGAAADSPARMGIVEFGTLLHVDSMETTPDGRLFVAATGVRVFRVLRVAVKDGYYTGAVTWLADEDDVGAVGGEANWAQAQRMAATLIGEHRASRHWPELVRDVGGPPDSVSALSFWLLGSLCPDMDERYRLMQEPNMQRRLVGAVAAAAGVPVGANCTLS